MKYARAQSLPGVENITQKKSVIHLSWEEKFFDILGEMKEAIGNLKAQNVQILEQTKKTNGTLLKHEERLRVLEAQNATHRRAGKERHRFKMLEFTRKNRYYAIGHNHRKGVAIMANVYTLVKRDGTREAVPFLTVKGQSHISDHISQGEFGQKDTGEVMIFEPLIQVFERARSILGKPILINSGYRSREYQGKLYQADLKAHQGRPSGNVAKPGNSPHMYGAAMDLALPKGWTARDLAALFRRASVELGYPPARTGWRQYGGSFLHIDLVFMLFDPYLGGIKNPNPLAWLPGVEW